MEGGHLKGLFIIVGLIMVAQAMGPAGKPLEAASVVAPGIDINISDSPTSGPENAPVTIVEFSDLECYYSARSSHTLKRIVGLYPTQVRWVFKNYPLRGRIDSPLAHEAAMAAFEQGKFREMLALLFENRDRLKREHLIKYASQLNLNMSAFTETLETRKFRPHILRDINQGSVLKVDETPTYFINGRRIIGARPLSEFRQLVERALVRVAPPVAAPVE